jgi:hypothetical protein
MKKHLKYLFVTFLIGGIGLFSCAPEEYSFGDLVTPTELSLNAAVVGQTNAAPGGDGSGKVTISTSAKNAITYKVDFGDGNVQMVPEGSIEYKYSTPGFGDYTITVTAVGTGGVTSVISTNVRVFVSFNVPPTILENLTGGSSKIWIIDPSVSGHVGVGQADLFWSNYYSAAPNERQPFLYDDEVKFEVIDGNVNMTVDNKGTTSIIAAATAFYGFSGPDGGYALDTEGRKVLAFSDATSGSTPDVSTQIQFTVPGNGIICFGTGGKTYEIIEITSTSMTLRNIGIDGLAWYQKLKVK